MKYFLLGAFASAFLLFGIAFLYGGTGTLDMQHISFVWLNQPEARPLILIGLAFSLVGLGFKASFAPFHQWTPDVYQGAPTNVSTFMATVAKVGAFGALARFADACVSLRHFWIPALSVLAALTILIGNFVALTQKDVKRILAYSSVANAGYVLVGIIAGRDNSNLVYFVLSYCLMTIGAFAVLSLAAHDGQEATTLDDLRGLWQRSPMAAACLAVCMISLIGIPPTSGFFGKFLIFKMALTSEQTPLAIVLAVGSVISIYYYLAIAFAAFAAPGEDVDKRFAKPSISSIGVYAICAAGLIGLSVFFAPVMNFLAPGAH